jgi:Phenylacetic acid-responsive transcriptional repressor
MLRDPTESYAQRLLITALGDYEHLVPEPIPSAGLVRMMDEFDLSEDSTRTALSRLVRRGYLSRFTEGRHTSYRLSELGTRLVAEGRARLLDFGTHRAWDGTWTLVAFSVSETRRSSRHVIHTHLRALGFAPFYDGVWISAHAEPTEVRSQLADVEHADVAIFSGQLLDATEGLAEKLYQTWKLDGIRQSYEEFLATFSPVADRVARDQVSPAEAFVTRTRLMDAWRSFPRLDPDIPEAMLPDGWPRAEAYRLFKSVYEELRPTAELRFLSFVTP